MPLPRASAVAASVAYAGLAVADTVLAAHPSASVRRWRLATKPLLMPALGTAFATAVAHPTTTRPRLLERGTLVAQGLSWGGDVALLGSGEPAFLAGLGSFFGAHVAYVGAFASAGRPVADHTHTSGVKAALGVAATLGPLMGWAAGRRAPELRAPVAAYATILSAMYATSTRLSADVPEPARQTVVAGTTLFLLSDATIGARKFLVREPRPWSDGVVMATYTLGQGLIALGVARAVRARRIRDWTVSLTR